MADVSDIEVIASTTAHSVVDQSVVLHHHGRAVPGVVLTPEEQPPRGLILIGHGAIGDKRSAAPLYVGRVLAKRHGFAAALIDAPLHGERVIDGVVFNDEMTPEFHAFIREPKWNDVMVEDWQAMTSATSSMVGLADDAPLGYWGLSMGCHFGLHYVAAEPRVQAAVLGLFGAYKRHLAAAAEVTCPLLFLVQWHDELFAHESVVDLYDAFSSRQKKLAANAGRHSSVPRAQLEETITFLATTVGATGDR
ncbi:MAG TPA: dienelactone hydrolase family protein [Acidimicrobiales bacterium]|nr:dienelactone hydrolase family protein [Acidimicrobiales bacterium]